MSADEVPNSVCLMARPSDALKSESHLRHPILRLAPPASMFSEMCSRWCLVLPPLPVPDSVLVFLYLSHFCSSIDRAFSVFLFGLNLCVCIFLLVLIQPPRFVGVSALGLKTVPFSIEHLPQFSCYFSLVVCSFGWQPRGEVLSSAGGPCSSALVYAVHLVEKGKLKFEYQNTNPDVLFKFLVCTPGV